MDKHETLKNLPQGRPMARGWTTRATMILGSAFFSLALAGCGGGGNSGSNSTINTAAEEPIVEDPYPKLGSG